MTYLGLSSLQKAQVEDLFYDKLFDSDPGGFDYDADRTG
jgi:hypothetical protein